MNLYNSSLLKEHYDSILLKGDTSSRLKLDFKSDTGLWFEFSNLESYEHYYLAESIYRIFSLYL